MSAGKLFGVIPWPDSTCQCEKRVTRFGALVNSRIHECAPDHSVETISVGELRRAADEMQALYDALNEFVVGQHGGRAYLKGERALAKARGEA